MYCSTCGNEIKDDDAFCQGCGKQLDTDQGSESQHSHPQTSVTNYSHSSSQVPSKNHKTYIILGWVFFGISILFIPILFGAGAFIMGFLTYKNNNDTHGVILMVMAIAGAILGSLLGMAAAPY
ncbi:zinc-ribbon domain-containing protein [Halobacillus shinanisalinarum]|uniref:Zinc-ribbon domain-containing protein n=1 Tax=Halobacillus shinanisalinarum TaxID=2932258 RepID=A0ABY4H2P8_9BACI|nr:zinc-ribbon domain-containing protein [Halobacillus shinanisalinarum]UOQ94394.1 zinc-ribbon domain-containing protein [Halobacillus shinanisalinarum]